MLTAIILISSIEPENELANNVRDIKEDCSTDAFGFALCGMTQLIKIDIPFCPHIILQRVAVVPPSGAFVTMIEKHLQFRSKHLIHVGVIGINQTLLGFPKVHIAE